MKRRVLDLCCCKGGAGYGYWLAGFEVVGVDIKDQPGYPFEFHRGDALTWPLNGFDLIHASPPCQAHTDLKNAWNARDHPDLIPRIRERLRASGIPYVIENVPGAPLVSPVILCGSMFGLEAGGYRLERHRLFEASFPLVPPDDTCGQDARPVVGVYGGKVRNRRAIATGSQRSRVGTTLPLEIGQRAMGISWMNGVNLSQAIPPAYTEWIGRQVMPALSR